MFENSTIYNLNTCFFFDAPVEILWNEVINVENWPSWWAGLDRIENLHRSGLVEGNAYKSVVGGHTPYRLSFYAVVDKVVPLSIISTKVNGDLEGQGVCRFSEKENRTELSLQWHVKPTRLWMKILSPVAHSYFVKHHDNIMDKGFRGLVKNIAQNSLPVKERNCGKN